MMYFKQIMMDDDGSLSYIIGCPEKNIACVIDPKDDVDEYLDAAERKKMKITHIFETNGNGKNTKGKIKLKTHTGADIYCLGDTSGSKHIHQAKDGQAFEFGNARLEIINGTSYSSHMNSIKVTDISNVNSPWLILNPKSLFLGDIVQSDSSGEEISDAVNTFLDS